MEYTVQAYIKKQSTQALEQFLEQCALPDCTEDYSHVIPDIQDELAQRKKENP